MKSKIFRFAAGLLLIQSFVLTSSVVAQDAKTAEVYAAIRKEANENSKIMRVVHYFTDMYGPRLTGSPNLTAAAKWGAREMQSWGFDRTELEPWEFGHPGWVHERATGLMISPQADTLTFEVLAWTPSTKGAVTSDVVSFTIPTFPAPANPNVRQNPTQEELTAYLNSMKAAVTGKIVLYGRPTFIDQTREAAPKRYADERIKCLMDPDKRPQDCPGGPTFGGPALQIPPRANALSGLQIADQVDKFFVNNNVLVRINESPLDRGAVRAFNNRTFDVTKMVPTVVMRNEDYGRIYRLLQDKTPVRLEFDLRSRTVPDGVTSYNMIGEIWGSDKKDEVIMLGGHLDSWHSATGASDNAVGCATMMEAARILKAIGVKPRRTIRVACWSGEEQGLFGSLAYVKKHFGSAENPTAGFHKFGGYLNMDSGTGRLRGLTVFGPPEAATILRDALAPFSDLGFAGVRSTRSRAQGGSDYTSFWEAGLPGIGETLDPAEYFGVSWHTNLDTYERIVEADVEASATIYAAALYTLAMRDELLPRFFAADMPKLPGAAPAATPSPTPAPTPKP